MKPANGRRRVVIEDVNPLIDAGQHAVRRVSGDDVVVTAAIYADGKDHIAARILYRHSSERRWRCEPMRAAGNDLWVGAFRVEKLGSWRFSIQGWINHFATWAGDLQKRIAAQHPTFLNVPPVAEQLDTTAGLETGSNPANQEIVLALRSGASLVREASKRAKGADAKRLQQRADDLEKLAAENRAHYDDPVDQDLLDLMARYPDLDNATHYRIELPVWVDRERAQFSSWYELFPRSASPVPGQHGTLRDVEQ